jgi:hypothetical protein
MRYRKFSFALLFIVPLFVFALEGCSSSPPSPEAAKVSQAAMYNQQMQNIDNNPNMPPEAKAAAKAAIERGQHVDMSIRK